MGGVPSSKRNNLRTQSGLGGGLRSLSAWNIMTVCGYLVAKEHHRMADSELQI